MRRPRFPLSGGTVRRSLSWPTPLAERDTPRNCSGETRAVLCCRPFPGNDLRRIGRRSSCGARGGRRAGNRPFFVAIGERICLFCRFAPDHMAATSSTRGDSRSPFLSPCQTAFSGPTGLVRGAISCYHEKASPDALPTGVPCRTISGSTTSAPASGRTFVDGPESSPPYPALVPAWSYWKIAPCRRSP